MATVGVKVELEGAKAFSDGMKNLSAQTKLFDTEIKNIQKSMSKSAFQKSIQEGEALKGKLSALQKESEMLKTRISEMSAAYGENDTRVIQLKQKYEALQGQIERTNQAIKDNGGYFGALGKQFEEIGSKLDAIGSKISNVGDTLTKNVTTPIVALGAASVAAFKDVDNGLDNIVKKTGATGQSLEDMNNIAKDIATTIPTSFDVVGNAIGEVNTRFGSTGEELQNLSTQFIEFADLNNTDVSNSVDTVQSAMAAFNVDSSKTAEVLDIMNKAGQDTGASMDKLGSDLLTNASALTEMGFNLNQSVGLLANLSKNGVDSASTMAGLKKAFQNASKEGKTVDQALKELQEQMSNASSNAEAYSYAIELFGAKAGPQLAKAINEGKLSLDAASNSVEDYANSVSSTFENTLDPMDQFQTNLNQMKLLGYDIANSAAPLITTAMESLSKVLKQISDAWNGLDEDTQQFIIKSALIVAALGPILSFVGRAVTSIGSIVKVVGVLIPKIASLGTIISGSVIPAITSFGAVLAPLLPIIAAVVAAIALVIAWFKNWGAISDWISEKIAQLKEFLVEHFGIIGELIAAKIELIWTIVKAVLDAIHIAIETVLKIIKALFRGNFNEIGSIVSDGWNRIKQTFSNAGANIKNIVSNLASSVISQFKNLVSSGITWGRDMIQNFINGILQKWEDLKNTVKRVANTVKDYLGFSEPSKGPLSNFHTFGPDMMMNYAEGIKSAQYLVKEAVEGVAMDVNSVMTNPIDAEEVYNAVREGAASATHNIVLNDREVTRALSGMGVAFV